MCITKRFTEIDEEPIRLFTSGVIRHFQTGIGASQKDFLKNLF